jgi:hypothetical protein
MKIEFVEFYPYNPEISIKKNKNILGTVHIYLIEEEMDIRGILVSKAGKGIYFHLPHYTAIDEETRKPVRYPHIRFTNDSKHKSLMDFLHNEVKTIIRERLLVKSE